MADTEMSEDELAALSQLETTAGSGASIEADATPAFDADLGEDGGARILNQ